MLGGLEADGTVRDGGVRAALKGAYTETLEPVHGFLLRSMCNVRGARTMCPLRAACRAAAVRLPCACRALAARRRARERLPCANGGRPSSLEYPT
eukprot:7389154-Prymnesium_polylepis.1